MNEIIKICGIGLLAAFCALILKSLKAEYAALVRIGGVVLLFGSAIIGTRELFSELSDMLSDKGVEPYVSMLLKALGIGVITKICSDVCRDCGESSVASGVELSGKISILALCVPQLKELMRYVSELLKLT